MNRLEKFVKTLGIVKSDIDRFFIRNLPPSADMEALQSPYSNVTMVYTCISTTARAISQVPVMITQRDSKGNDVPVNPKHPWQTLVNKPNYMMSRSMFIENVLSFWLLDGNVCIIPFPTNTLGKKGVPDAIWPVRWKFMSFTKDSNGHVEQWHYKPNPYTKPIDLAPEDVLHLKFFNPDDSVAGLAPHEAGKIALRSNYRAGAYNAQFFENGAVPGGVLQTDKQLSKGTFERTKSQINQDYGVKQGNAHKLMVLEQGLKWASTGITQRDMEFVELYRLSQEEIMQIYGMKKVIISANTGGANRATAQVERTEWWQGTCLPLMRNMMEIMSWGLFEFRNLPFKMSFDISAVEALAEDFANKAKTAEILLRLGYTRNEVNDRLEMGFPKVDWGDVAYMPVNMMPVNLEGGVIQPGGHGGQGGDNPNPNNPQDNPGSNPQDPGDSPDQAPNPQNPDVAASVNTRPAAKEALLLNRWKQLTHMSSGFEDQLKGKVERVFFDMRKATLDMFNRDKSIEDLERMSYDLQKSSFIKFSSPILAGSAMTGATSAEQEFDMDEKTLDNESMVLNFLNARTIVLRSIIDTVKSDVLDNLRSAMLNNNDAEKAIKDAFNAAKNRAKTIARTEVMSAFNYGRHSVIIRSPYSLKEWFSPTGESRHSAMNGKQVGTQEHWQMPDGTILGYPTDMAGGAKQCTNCQCVEFIVN